MTYLVLVELILIVIYVFLTLGSSDLQHNNREYRENNQKWFELPFMPKSLPNTQEDYFYYNSSAGKIRKYIPRILWVAVKHRDDPLPDHFNEMIKKNVDWKVNICDNRCKDDFMDTVFGNTSITALYHLINPVAYASKADIWRYCVLYTYGGLYMDDDSLIGTLFSDVVDSKDKVILSEEGPSSLGDCYIPSYHLHDENSQKRFYHNYTMAKYYDGLDKQKNMLFFHGNTLVNWGIFTMPRHPLFYYSLKNIFEILHAEYTRHPVLHISKWDHRWKYVLCGTTFVMTYTLRELALLNDQTMLLHAPRICHRDFQQYYGKAKAIWTGKIPGHYMKAMNKDKNINILKHHAPLDIHSIIQYLEGSAITGESKDVYYVQNGIRRPFGSYDRFIAMNFTDSRIRHVKENILQTIPLGSPVETVESTLPILTKPMTAVTTVASGNNSTDNSQILIFLKKVRTEINKTNYSCYGDDYSGTRDDFLNDVWKKYIGDQTTVMVYPMCLRTFQLGNTLGYFLNDLACSNIAGSHFIGISKDFDITGADPKNRAATPGKGNSFHLSFFQALPDVVIHPKPELPTQAKVIMRKECHCLQYCWENNEAPWIKRIAFISSYLRKAINAYLETIKQSSGVTEIKTILNNETDFVYVSKSILDLNQNNDNLVPSKLVNSLDLPLLPDVTIQYRCGDNIGFGKTRYGLLPFRAFRNRIPSTVKTVYIIADSPTRSIYHAYSGRCAIILEHLGKYIHKAFPKAKVVIKRGGDLLLDYARLAYSSVTICSASTFCLWPALANLNTVHFPLTPLVAKADKNESAPDFGWPSFHWIRDVLLIKEFKSFRPWTKLIDTLEEDN